MSYLVFLLLLLHGCQAQHRVGWQAPNGAAVIFDTFGETFDVVSQKLGEDYELVPVVDNADLQQAAINGSIDYLFAGPTMAFCVMLLNNMAPLVTVNTNQGNSTTSVLSGSIVVPQSSDITGTSELGGKVIGAGPFSALTTFQAESGFLSGDGFNVFTDTRAIVQYGAGSQITAAVLSGEVDAGFVPTAEQPPGIRVLNPTPYPDQMFPSTTPTYSSQVLAASASVPEDIRTALVNVLLNLDPAVLVRGAYGGWSVPRGFVDIRHLAQTTGLLSVGGDECNAQSQTYEFVECPVGFQPKPDRSISTSCEDTEFRCPADAAQCICSPCVKIVRPRHVGSLSVGAFSGVLAAVVACLLMVVPVAVARRRNRVDFIHWPDLNVNPREVLGQTSKGLVLEGCYNNRRVACKRAFPRTAMGNSVFDVVKADEAALVVSGVNLGVRLAGWGEEVAAALGAPTRISRRGKAVAKMVKRDHPNILTVLGASRGSDGYELIAVMELAPRGTLQDLLDNRSVKIPLGSLLKLALDVARGLAFLHSNDQCCDTRLAASSVLISESFECKLSRDVSPGGKVSEPKLMFAPEVLRGGPPGLAADMYSFGMLLYYIVHRTEPFAGCDISFVAEGVCDLTSDEIIQPVITEEGLADDVRFFMYRCWDDDPARRPLVQEAVDLLTPYAGLSLASQLLMEAAQQRSLLQQILPDHVLEALQEGRTPSSRTFDMVTVFFSDIKGFTSISSTQTSEDVMSMLDELYKKFDALCTKHNLMKVETIGDSYMLVGGLKLQGDHAARVARFALEAVEAAHTVVVPGDGAVQIRSGFHSGPVTSGVVGTEVPRYCLFGDTVNTASRMESTGLVDKIQMSAAAAHLVKQQDPDLAIRITGRAGLVTPKGKSPMQTFWLFTDDDMRHVRTAGVHLVRRNSDHNPEQDHGDSEAAKRRRAGSLDLAAIGGRKSTGGKLPIISESSRPKSGSMDIPQGFRRGFDMI